jgi:geranylgeranyl pyrophosphate synthase
VSVGSPSSSDALGAYLEEARAWSEAQLERLLPPLLEAQATRAGHDAGSLAGGTPRILAEVLRYAATGGGKRIRPCLVRLFAEALSEDPAAAAERAARPAVALELIHAYSLVHDDLPCMDDDDLRRGRPTVHVAYDEALAVLAGDALQGLAFELLADAGAGAAAMVGVLARAGGAAGMVGGQVLDLYTDARGTGVEGVREVHARKTAALFAAAGELGALAAGADTRRQALAARYGHALGLCFQATDDLLDVTGDAASLGKTPGKDAELGRDTLVAWLGLDGTRAEAAERAAQADAAAADLGLPPEHPARALVERVLHRTS